MPRGVRSTMNLSLGFFSLVIVMMPSSASFSSFWDMRGFEDTAA